MLQQANPQVSSYLDRAEKARGLALQSSDPETRAFYIGMEASWTRLATSVAFVDRVDLFLHTLNHKLPPLDICAVCYKSISLKVIEVVDGRQIHTFECSECGREQVREV